MKRVTFSLEDIVTVLHSTEPDRSFIAKCAQVKNWQKKGVFHKNCSNGRGVASQYRIGDLMLAVLMNEMSLLGLAPEAAANIVKRGFVSPETEPTFSWSRHGSQIRIDTDRYKPAMRELFARKGWPQSEAA